MAFYDFQVCYFVPVTMKDDKGKCVTLQYFLLILLHLHLSLKKKKNVSSVLGQQVKKRLEETQECQARGERHAAFRHKSDENGFKTETSVVY